MSISPLQMNNLDIFKGSNLMEKVYTDNARTLNFPNRKHRKTNLIMLTSKWKKEELHLVQ